MKKALNIISCVIFCLMFIITAFFAAMKFMGETPNFFGYSLYYVVTGSMEPEISAGDIIIGKYTDPDKLRVGDVITYNGLEGQTKDRIITHEIIDIRNNADDGALEFITKGTANDAEDPPVMPDQILSKTVMKVPLAGKILSVVNSRWGFLIIIILPLAVLLVNECVSLVKACREIKKSKSKKEEQQIETETEQPIGQNQKQ